MKISNAKKLIACLMATLTLLTSLSVCMVYAVDESDFTYKTQTNWETDIVEIYITGYKGSDSKVVIPETIEGRPVTTICDSAFKGNTTITSVTIPDSVTKIDDWAFENCTNLAEINLPSNLEDLGGDILANTAYSLDGANWDGEYLYIGKYLLKATNEIKGDVKIKDGTELIASFTFSYNNEIKSATIPASVKTICSYAFSECDNLTTVTFNEGLDVIGFGAFQRTALSDVKLPKSVTSIGGWAFYHTDIKNIEISANVNNVNDSAFDSCTSLESITVDSNNKKYYSKDGILFEKSKYDWDGDTLLVYPAAKKGDNYTITENVYDLGYNAFTNLVYLKNLNIPATIEWLSGFGITSLENVNIAEDHKIYKSVDGVIYSKDGTSLIYYPGGRNVEKYEVPNTIKKVEMSAISGNSSIKEITIPEGVEEISSSSIYYCDNLTTINLPSSLNVIEEDFVTLCKSITAINYNGTKAQWESLDTSINFPYYMKTEGVYVYCTDGEIELIPANNGDEGDFTIPTESTESTPAATTAPADSTEPTTTTITATDPSEPEVTGTTATEPSESVPAESTASKPADTTPSESATATAPAESEYQLGDANMDKKLNIRDATLIQKHLAKITTMSEEALKLADFNNDSKVNVKDATSIQKFIAGIK